MWFLQIPLFFLATGTLMFLDNVFLRLLIFEAVEMNKNYNTIYDNNCNKNCNNTNNSNNNRCSSYVY